MKHNHEFVITVYDEESKKVIDGDIRYTEKGYSDLANRFYKKYGENITVYVDEMINRQLKKVCTYHA